MNDLIDRARIAETVGFIAACSYGDPIDAKDVLKAIDEAPTIDAVEVVRCRECKHAEPIPAARRRDYSDPDKLRHCTLRRTEADVYDVCAIWEDCYCDEGERKEATDGRSD